MVHHLVLGSFCSVFLPDAKVRPDGTLLSLDSIRAELQAPSESSPLFLSCISWMPLDITSAFAI